jgi:hypothetical protein
MAALISVFVVAAISIVVTRIGAIALTHTGLSREVARFQARSAFLGVGFTTNEAEAVVNHPVRRRIVSALILLGNVGIVSAGASLVLSFTRATGEQAAARAGVLAIGLLVLVLLVRLPAVSRALSHAITAALRRWTDLEVRDYEELLELAGDYGVMELLVEEGDWLADGTLGELGLRDEGVVVLGLRRPGGEYVGAPGSSTAIRAGDTLTIYARTSRLCELDERRPGDQGDLAHRDAVAEQDAIEAAEAEALA